MTGADTPADRAERLVSEYLLTLHATYGAQARWDEERVARELAAEWARDDSDFAREVTAYLLTIVAWHERARDVEQSQ